MFLENAAQVGKGLKDFKIASVIINSKNKTSFKIIRLCSL